MTELQKTPLCTLFVYGTLKRNYTNHEILRNRGGIYTGTGYTTENTYSMFEFKGKLSYPVVFDTPLPPGILSKKGHIKGEVFRIPMIQMQQLDNFEGHTYKRDLKPIAFHFPNDITHAKKKWYLTQAWIYVGLLNNWEQILRSDTIETSPFFESKADKINYFYFTNRLLYTHPKQK